MNVKIWVPVYKGAFYQVWLKLALRLLRRIWKVKKLKSENLTDGQTVDWRKTTGDKKNSLELSAQLS